MAMKFDPRLLPSVPIAINVLAAVGYMLDGGMNEWRKIAYWLSAAAITYVVTW